MRLDHYKEVGGHAPKFAERITKEKCGVYFPGSFTNFTNQFMKDLGKLWQENSLKETFGS